MFFPFLAYYNKYSWYNQNNLDYLTLSLDFPGGSVVKNLPANVGDMGLVLESGDPLEKKMAPLQYSCLGNLMDRGAWWVTVRRVAKQPDMT